MTIDEKLRELEFIKGTFGLIDNNPYRSIEFKLEMVQYGMVRYYGVLKELNDANYDKHELDELRSWMLSYLVKNGVIQLPKNIDGISIPCTKTMLKKGKGLSF
jgi:hypothetical protein